MELGYWRLFGDLGRAVRRGDMAKLQVKFMSEFGAAEPVWDRRDFPGAVCKRSLAQPMQFSL